MRSSTYFTSFNWSQYFYTEIIKIIFRTTKKKQQLSYRLQQLKDSLESGPVELPTFRELLKQDLQQNEEARKDALHALIERIQACPDRKVEVKFRIGEKTEGTGGGQNFDPHESTYPVRDLNPCRQRERLVSWTRLDERGETWAAQGSNLWPSD